MATPQQQRQPSSLIEFLASRSTDPILTSSGAGGSTTGGEIIWLANDLALAMQDSGLEPGGHVGVWLPPSAESAALLLALLISGRTVVPLNLRGGPTTNASTIADAGVRHIVGTPHFRDRTAELALVLSTDLVHLDHQHGSAPERAAHLPPSSSTEPKLMLSTSGTSGKPKLVPLNGRELLEGAYNVVAAHGLDEHDRSYCVLPVYHINGLVMTLLAPLVSGGSSVISEGGFSASRYWEDVRNHEVTWLSVVPTVVGALIQRTIGPAPPYVRFARSASAPLALGPHHDFESEFEIPLFETMGMTEAAGPVLCHPMPGAGRQTGETGIPTGSVELKVMKADESSECAPGEVGHLWVRGPSVVPGYYANPHATSTSFRSGWFVSGDLASQSPDGLVSVVGRERDLINKGGEKISPREIDEAALSFSGVLDAAAFSIADVFFGSTVALAIVADNVGDAELLAHIAGVVGEFKTPTILYRLDELPKGPSGKLQRRFLEERFDVQSL